MLTVVVVVVILIAPLKAGYWIESLAQQPCANALQCKRRAKRTSAVLSWFVYRLTNARNKGDARVALPLLIN
jgi:hypothetical protein